MSAALLEVLSVSPGILVSKACASAAVSSVAAEAAHGSLLCCHTVHRQLMLLDFLTW
jgi:hypothetical protein